MYKKVIRGFCKSLVCGIYLLYGRKDDNQVGGMRRKERI